MASPRDSFIIHNGAAPDQLGAFQAAALARSSSRVESVFPERALGRCRICGKVAVRNEEHVPPRSAYNKGRFTDLPIFTMLTGDRQPPSQHVPTQGGQPGYTLCEPCNRLTGNRWAPEYQRWVWAAGRRLGSRETMDRLNDSPVPHVAENMDFGMVYPGRFMRQAISMLLSMSGSADLADRFPELRRLALGGDAEPLPAAVHIYLVLYGDPETVRAGHAVQGDVERGDLWEVIFIDFPPFGLFAVVDGPPPDIGVDISPFAEFALDHRLPLTLPFLTLGFGTSTLPCDYRTAGQLGTGATDHT